MYNVYCILYNVYCILHFVYCILYILSLNKCSCTKRIMIFLNINASSREIAYRGCEGKISMSHKYLRKNDGRKVNLNQLQIYVSGKLRVGR